MPARLRKLLLFAGIMDSFREGIHQNRRKPHFIKGFRRFYGLISSLFGAYKYKWILKDTPC